eukprot:669021-Rhodomonas_salina.1
MDENIRKLHEENRQKLRLMISKEFDDNPIVPSFFNFLLYQCIKRDFDVVKTSVFRDLFNEWDSARGSEYKVTSNYLSRKVNQLRKDTENVVR